MAKVETERFFGKKGIIIMIRDGSKLVSAIFKDKKNADKFNRNKPADVKKLLQLAKKTKFPKGIDEDTDVGHQDDEPNMLKSTTLEIMEYGKKLTDMLDKYDDMDGEVDFPNWWQKKLILARDYVSAAYHYLDSEEKTSENMDRNFRSYDDEEEVEEGFASNAQRKAAFASGYKAKGKKGKKKNESVNEGKKRYYQQDRVGSAKYTISYHDGKKKHKDGSDFFDIQTFRNKKDLAKFVNTLHKGGYVYGFGESVNEAYIVLYSPKKGVKPVTTAAYKDKKDAQKWAKDLGGITMIVKKKVKGIDEEVNEASKLAMGIAGFTGTRGVAVDNFIEKHNIDSKKLFNFVKKGNLKDRMAFVSAIAGRPNNKMFKMITKKFSESINECWDTHKQVGMKMKGGKQVPNCVPKNEIKEDKNQIVQLKKKVGKSEIKFYDALSKIEKKLGKKNYRAFLEKGLKDFKLNPKHYDYRSNGAAEEKLFNLAK
jgi:hypothetical protein